MTGKFPKNLNSIITLLLLFFFVLCSFSACSSDVNYVSYSSPIMPLTGIDEYDGVQVSRNITLDFKLYEKLRLDHMYDSYSIDVVDEYTLYNPDDQKHSITLAYPFTGNLLINPKMIPQVIINGEAVCGELLSSYDPEHLVQNAYNFEAFQKAMSEEDFLAKALSETTEGITPVTVYHFYDIALFESSPASEVFLHVEYEKGENTTIWANDYDYTSDTGLCVNVKKGELWLYVVGEPLSNLRTGGIIGYEVDEKSKTDSVICELEIYEDTLENCLAAEAARYDLSEDHIFIDLVTPEHILPCIMKELLLSDGKSTEPIIHIGSLFYRVVAQQKIMYILFEVELEANSQCTIQISFAKEPCVGSVRRTNGYEVATTLNSSLYFTDQTVSVVNYTGVDLSKTNTTIDIENGIISASLDLNTDRYFINVFH